MGWLGIDRFYAVRPKYAFIKLFTFGLFGIWWIIDIFMALFGWMRDGNGQIIHKWTYKK
ncbi:TM2 domain-containing protein [Mycoplasma zalophidermidis]|uniref:TM2 domain-containing protein n=1 Tax=Mycoplasma zalophidermidis TaxID=398174 RepID=UPI00358FC302